MQLITRPETNNEIVHHLRCGEGFKGAWHATGMQESELAFSESPCDEMYEYWCAAVRIAIA